MAGFITAISEVLMYGPEGGKYAGGEKYSSISIAGVDPTDPSKMFESLPERTLQYWPESVSDSYEIGWNFKDIPGASHALAQWASNNGRTISFDVHFHRFTRPIAHRTSAEKLKDIGDKAGPKADPSSNVDIRNEIAYLRGYCYPTYGVIGGIKGSFPPPVAILNIPGLGLNESDGSDSIFAVMTQCEVTYILCFPNGTPRHATVSLAFKQIVQKANGVEFKGWPDNYVSASQIEEEKMLVGGGRKTAKLSVGNVK